jgi:hypothetical protein
MTTLMMSFFHLFILLSLPKSTSEPSDQPAIINGTVTAGKGLSMAILGGGGEGQYLVYEQGNDRKVHKS